MSRAKKDDREKNTNIKGISPFDFDTIDRRRLQNLTGNAWVPWSKRWETLATCYRQHFWMMCFGKSPERQECEARTVAAKPHVHEVKRHSVRSRCSMAVAAKQGQYTHRF
ncbi:hypothetical protein BST61_g5547 [Cercospora zeina]